MFGFLDAPFGNATLEVIFLYGLVTGLHCIGMCGGFALSGGLAAGGGRKSMGLGASLGYNLGRLFSYGAAGALAGSLGGAVSLMGPFKGVIPLIGGLFVLVMGLGSLGVLNFRPSFSFISANRLWGTSRSMVPLGLLSVLLPCGPLQAMLIYALGSADPVKSALSMSAFAVGTMPPLLGFGILSGWLNARFSRIAAKVSAAVLICMGVAMAARGLTLLGAGPLRLPFTADPGRGVQTAIRGEIQFMRTSFDPRGYPPLTVFQGVPVKWLVHMDKRYTGACAASIEIPAFGVRRKFAAGENLIEFVPDKEGVFTYTSWCGMISNTITVVQKGEKQ